MESTSRRAKRAKNTVLELFYYDLVNHEESNRFSAMRQPKKRDLVSSAKAKANAVGGGYFRERSGEEGWKAGGNKVGASCLLYLRLLLFAPVPRIRGGFLNLANLLQVTRKPFRPRNLRYAPQNACRSPIRSHIHPHPPRAPPLAHPRTTDLLCTAPTPRRPCTPSRSHRAFLLDGNTAILRWSNVRRRYGKGGMDCLNLETIGIGCTIYMWCVTQPPTFNNGSLIIILSSIRLSICIYPRYGVQTSIAIRWFPLCFYPVGICSTSICRTFRKDTPIPPTQSRQGCILQG